MSLLITHIDDDGKAAAAIAYREMFPFDLRPTPEDIIFYNYQDTPICPDRGFFAGEKVVLVDISINDHIFDLVKRAVDAGCQVIHIDHHETTTKFIDNITPEQKAVYNKVYTFFHQAFSATMLCWIWASAHPDERADIYNTVANVIDFSADWTLLAFYPGTDKERVYRIPDVVRYVNDWDIWKFEIADTKAFHYGFDLELEKNPDAKLWDELIYNPMATMIIGKKYLEPGRIIEKCKESEYAMLRRKAFDAKIPGYDNLSCIAINGISSSFAFGDMIDTYDVAVLFHYDGPDHTWKYSIYSGENSEVDVSTIAKFFGGGGHKHASGFRTGSCIFA